MRGLGGEMWYLEASWVLRSGLQYFKYHHITWYSFNFWPWLDPLLNYCSLLVFELFGMIWFTVALLQCLCFYFLNISVISHLKPLWLTRTFLLFSVISMRDWLKTSKQSTLLLECKRTGEGLSVSVAVPEPQIISLPAPVVAWQKVTHSSVVVLAKYRNMCEQPTL